MCNKRTNSGILFKNESSFASFSALCFNENSSWKLIIDFKEDENDASFNFFFGERGSCFYGFTRVKNKIYYRLGNGEYIGGLPYHSGEHIRLEVTYDQGQWKFFDGNTIVECYAPTEVIFNAIGSGYNGKEHEQTTIIFYVSISEYSKELEDFCLVAEWKMDTNYGCIAFDHSGNHRHAVLNNTQWVSRKRHEVSLTAQYSLARSKWENYTKQIPAKQYEFMETLLMKEKEPLLWRNILNQINNLENIKKGKNILKNIYHFDRFDPIELPNILTWKEDPFKNRSWQWQYQQFIFYTHLIAAYENTKDIKYLEKLIEIIKSWYLLSFTDKYPSELTWSDHTTALRLRSMIYIWEYLKTKQDIVGYEIFEILLNLIETHCNILSSDTFYNKHNNHGFDQSLFLYWTSVLFPEFENAQQWHDIGYDRLIDEIGVAFTSEGVHVENSPSYLIGMLQRIYIAAEILHNYEGKNIVNIDVIINNALKVLAYLLHPDGTLPMLGDTDHGTKVYQLGQLKKFSNYNLFQYVYSKGKKGSIKNFPVDVVFEESGYAVFRDSWHSYENYDHTVHCVFKCSFLSTFHRHDDDLNFILQAYGEEWFVDGGIYKYDEKDPYRMYLRSAKAHNIPIIEKACVSRSINFDANKQSKIIDYSLGGNVSWIKAKSFMYEGYCVERKIEYIRPNKFIIFDKINADTGEKKEYKLMFHIPMDKKIVINDGDNTIKIIGKNTYKLYMSFEGECNFDFEILSGKKDGEVIGWQSKIFGKIEPIQTLCCNVIPMHNEAYSIIKLILMK
jgi:hypothetical protein